MVVGNKRKIILLCSFILILAHIPAFASGRDEIVFEHLSLEKGLSQTTVNAILKDHRGYMWFGTDGGLNRYDGYTFRVFRHEPFSTTSLSNNIVTSLYEDAEGFLWVGTFGGGLNRFDPVTETFRMYHYPPNSKTFPPIDLISKVIGDKKGNIWVGTFQKGLARFNPSNNTWSIFKSDDESGLGGNKITAFFVDTTGTLWVGTDGGLSEYKGNDIFQTYRPTVFPYVAITAITDGRKGNLWIGTESGQLYLLHTREKWFEYIPLVDENNRVVSSSTITGLYQDIFEDLWIVTDGGGLLRYDRGTKQVLTYQIERDNPHSLRDNKIRAIYGDRKDTIFLGDLTGIVWLGTHSGGVEKFHLKRPFQRYNGKSFLIRQVSGDNVYAVYKEGYDSLWVGTYGNGIKVIMNNGTVQHYRHNPDNSQSVSSDRVLAFFRDREGTMWVGTDNGLCRFNRSNQDFTLFLNQLSESSLSGSNKITSILEDSNGTFWVGTMEGLYRFLQEEGLFYSIPWSSPIADVLKKDLISCLFEDSQKTLWIGTVSNGFYCIDLQNNSVKHYFYDPTNSQSFPGNRVFSIYEDRDRTFWIATAEGLCRFDRKYETFSLLTSKDGFVSDSIRGILEDNYKNLWISTGNGLSQYDIKTGAVRNYNLGDGLQAKEFNATATFKDSFGRMYFGGINGCNSFFPTDVWENSHIPPIVINRVLVMNKPLQPYRTKDGKPWAILSYRDNFLSIDFSALDYTHPESNQYRYKLEGFDMDWVSAGNRHYAHYTNLPPGRYTFKVMGSNNNDVWNKEGTSLLLDVVPPPWKTPLAYVGYMFLTVILFWFVQKYLKNRQEKETERRLRLVTEKNNEQLRCINTKLEKARLQEEAYRDQLRGLASALSMAEEKERRRIAEEVHDSIGQNLALTKIRLALLSECVEERQIKDDINGILQTLEGSIQSTRTLTFELGSPVLYRLGFPASVEWLAEKMEENYGLQVSYENRGLPEKMNDDLKAFLFRALRELLMNVVKHSGVRQAHVKTSCSAGTICLTVSDSGKGFDAHSIDDGISKKQTFGLFSLRERLCSLGGHLVITSKEGKGVRITIFVPVNSFK